MLVLHYTDMPAQAAIDHLCNPESKVSAHYLIDRAGSVYSMVDECDRAWHAGVSCWRGHTNINHRSIGIELENPGHKGGYIAYTDVQMQALVALAKTIQFRYNIPNHNIVGHSDIAPARKQDPGELFDWSMLATHGLGIWPHMQMSCNDIVDSKPVMCRKLAAFGYQITEDMDAEQVKSVVVAFQRHFRPHLVNGGWDAECATLLASLLRLI